MIEKHIWVNYDTFFVYSDNKNVLYFCTNCKCKVNNEIRELKVKRSLKYIYYFKILDKGTEIRKKKPNIYTITVFFFLMTSNFNSFLKALRPLL